MNPTSSEPKWAVPTPLSTLRDISALGFGREEAVKLCQLLADNTREGVIFLDRQGQILMANATGSTLLGGSRQCLGKPLNNLLQAMSPDGYQCSVQESLFKRLCEGETCTVALSHGPADLYLIHSRQLNTKSAYAVAWLRKLNSPREAMLRAGGLDSLTGFAGRQSFENALSQAMERAQSGVSSGLLYIDLYHFKVVNESCGNDAGDELLKQVAGIFVSCLRGKDMLARLGSDEFGVLLSDCSLSGAQQMASRIVKKVESFRFRWSGQELAIGVSIGVVAINDEGESANQLLAAANASCNVAKKSGRNRIKVYHGDAKMKARQESMQWLSKIQKAIAEDRFVLYAQPIVETADLDRHHHSEVLLRMLDEEGGLVSPGQFIPAAEQFGLMEELDRLVLRKVLAFMSEQDSEQHYAVNVSGASLGDSKFCDYACKMLDKTGVNPHRIQFEITETAAISSRRAALEFMRELGDRGCKFFLDDFGRGQSSLAYLRDLPVHYIKIDGLFVKNMLRDAKDYAMVSTINHLAHVMGLQTVAEYVESEELRQALEELGVDFIQGYLVSRPEPLK
ncbi:EAL domain-containing protein [uncultured Pseudoteredinibacter sp.]|uniref:sensor domain-containing protein n=1 Tax=uncultured Pseudoteredinibacter sp. TaxID=1641701 RepID=UPI0026264C36|nr:EAL domain-containing protein [uncultured Pseudoteredinibacter sp.]